MTKTKDLPGLRLRSLRLASAPAATPGELVTYLGAVQAQDHPAARWALGLRLPPTTEAAVEQALADKAIVRTGFMRGTLHFLPGPDIRWMLALLAPRIRQLVNNGARANKISLDEADFARANAAFAQALQGGRQMTRPEWGAALQQAGIDSAGLRGALLAQRALGDGVVCYGAWRGSHATLTLLEVWVPPAPSRPREAALAEFVRRYFVSHGPATIQDFVWWSGLTSVDARAGIEQVKDQLHAEVVDGQTYWQSAAALPARAEAPRAFLLPNYDEYTVGYRDRSAVFDPALNERLGVRGSIVFHHTLVVDGQVVGAWKRTAGEGTVVVTVTPFAKLSAPARRAAAEAAQRYAAFLGRPVELFFSLP